MLVKYILKIAMLALFVLLVYFLAGWIVPPLLRHRSVETVSLPSANGAEERVLCIDDNMDALLWRMRVIEEAESEIFLSTFDFCEDESGLDMMACLLAAADRGVKVKILDDGINAALHLTSAKHFHALAAHENVEVKIYNSYTLTRTWKANYRLHDKILLADGRVYILGGRNTNDLFLGNGQRRQNIDRDMLVYHTSGDGGSIGEVSSYFASLWALDCSRPRNGNISETQKTAAQDALRGRYKNLRAAYPEVFAGTDWRGATMEAERVSLIANAPGAENKAPVLWDTLCARMGGAKDVLVETPYIILDRQMYADLAEITGRGTQLRFLTNAVESGANVVGCADYLNQKKHILGTGAEIYEHGGARSMHKKTLLIDENISIIGSFNFDIRSTRLDTETMLVIDCPALNALLRGSAEQDMSESKHVFPDGREEAGAEYAPAAVGFPKMALYTLLRVLIVPIRHLL